MSTMSYLRGKTRDSDTASHVTLAAESGHRCGCSQTGTRFHGSNSDPLVSDVVQNVVILLLDVANDGEIGGTGKGQASGALLIHFQKDIVGGKNEVHALKVQSHGREGGVSHARQIIAEVEPILRAVDSGILNEVLQRRQEGDVCRVNELTDGRARVQNHSSSSRVHIQIENSPRNVSHGPVVHGDAVQLHIVEGIGSRVAQQRSVLDLQGRACHHGFVSEDQRARLGGGARNIDQAVREFGADQRPQLLVQGDGATAQPHQPIDSREGALVPPPAAESEIGERPVGAIGCGESQRLQSELALSSRLVAIAVSVCANPGAVRDLRQLPAHGAEVADSPVSRGFSRLKNRIGLLVAIGARGALQPDEVAACIDDGGLGLRGSAQRDGHDVASRGCSHRRLEAAAAAAGGRRLGPRIEVYSSGSNSAGENVFEPGRSNATPHDSDVEPFGKGGMRIVERRVGVMVQVLHVHEHGFDSQIVFF